MFYIYLKTKLLKKGKVILLIGRAQATHEGRTRFPFYDKK